MMITRDKNLFRISSKDLPGGTNSRRNHERFPIFQNYKHTHSIALFFFFTIVSFCLPSDVKREGLRDISTHSSASTRLKGLFYSEVSGSHASAGSSRLHHAGYVVPVRKRSHLHFNLLQLIRRRTAIAADAQNAASSARFSFFLRGAVPPFPV